MIKLGLLAWEFKIRLPFSVFFMFPINLFKSSTSIIIIPYVGISALYLTSVYINLYRISRCLFSFCFLGMFGGTVQIFPRRTVV